MNILLTGITGFIGKYLSNKLIADGHKVCAIVRKTTNIQSINKNINTYIFGDDSYKNLHEFIVNNKVDGVVHLATNFLPDHTYEDIQNMVEANITFPVKVLDIVVKTNIKWFVNTGTVWQNYNGSDEYLPTNLYSATKQAFDDMLSYYDQISDCKFTTLKICDTFGKNDKRKKIMNLLKDLQTTDVSELDMSPGEQLIDILYINDVVSGYIKLIEYIDKTDKSLIKNEYLLSSGELIKLRELVLEYEKIANVELPIKWGGRLYRDREIMKPWVAGHIVPCWEKKYNLNESIKLFLEEENE
jgi:CDP-paratose synthetase